MSRDFGAVGRRRGELALALQAVAVDHGLREVGTDLEQLEAVARATGARAAFLGGALAHGVATPRSTVDLYLLGSGPARLNGLDDDGRNPTADQLADRTRHVWLESSDLAFVSRAADHDLGADLGKVRLLADVDQAFPVFGVQAVIELVLSPDPKCLFRWAIGCLIQIARIRLQEARGLIETDLSRHAGLPLVWATLATLSAILWTRGVPVPDPVWATAIAERNNQQDTLVEQANDIALSQRHSVPEEVHERSRRVESLIASAESWAP